jgi:glycosyltransferase involved in cell wall biosynthesis
MKISVVIPTYNRASVIGGTIDSIAHQTLCPHEIIVVDDGSTDETRAIVEQLSLKESPLRGRIRYIYQENQGKSVALNRGLSQVSGDWIAYDDSDDVWLHDKLARQRVALEHFPDCGACVTNTAYGDSGITTFEIAGARYAGEIGRLQDARWFVRPTHGVMMQTVVVRTDVMTRTGPFDPRLRVGQDADFLFRLSLETPICYVNAPLVALDRTPDPSRLTVRFPMLDVSRLELTEHMLQQWRSLAPANDPRLQQALRSRLTEIRSAKANQLLHAGRATEACGALAAALQDWFTLPVALKWIGARFAPGLAKRLVRQR